MMKKVAVGVSIAIAVGVALILAYTHSTRGLTLMAKMPVSVYATESDAVKSPPPEVFSALVSGQSVPVLACIDVKHYIIYKVQLPDGRKGFVLEGDYILMRNGEQAFCP